MTPRKDSVQEAAEYAKRQRARERRAAIKAARTFVGARKIERTEPKPAIKVGDFVNVHGFTGTVVEIREFGFVYEGGPGEFIYYRFDWTIKSQTRTCWILEQ
jgi:dsDNA-specific endonuclease/ATPase MutS2